MTLHWDFPIHQEQRFYIPFRYIYFQFPIFLWAQSSNAIIDVVVGTILVSFAPHPQTVICGKNFTLKDLISLIRGDIVYSYIHKIWHGYFGIGSFIGKCLASRWYVSLICTFFGCFDKYVVRLAYTPWLPSPFHVIRFYPLYTKNLGFVCQREYLYKWFVPDRKPKKYKNQVINLMKRQKKNV